MIEWRHADTKTREKMRDGRTVLLEVLPIGRRDASDAESREGGLNDTRDTISKEEEPRDAGTM